MTIPTLSISILTNPDRASSDHLQIDRTSMEWINLVPVHDAKTGYQGQCPVIQGIWSWFPQCKRGAPEKELHMLLPWSHLQN